MGSDAISSARLSAFARNSPKKKQGNRLGKVKENKVDIRGGQRIFEVKNKSCKVESDTLASTSPKLIGGCKVRSNLPIKMQSTSKKMGLSHYSSGKDFTERMTKTRTRRSSSSSSSSFTSSEGGRERDDDHGCLHSWEAVADALHSESFIRSCDHRYSEPIHRTKDSVEEGRGYIGCTRAWTPDDSFRPRSLPRVSSLHQQKQNQEMQKPVMQKYGQIQNVVSEKISVCPICCEDFDVTDSSFRPCPCGFCLCLFCHKRILEVDARCPGCRKQYDSVGADAGFGCEPMLAQSWSMNRRFC